MTLLDTDHLSVLTDDRHASQPLLFKRMSEHQHRLALPLVAVEEHLRGLLALIHRYNEIDRQLWGYHRLYHSIIRLREADIISVTTAVANRYKDLQKLRIKIGTQDLKIAAIALAHDALLVSNNLKDFKRIPGLRVESWIA